VGGFLLGLAAFLVDFPVVGDVKILTETWGISFMMQAWWLFVISSIIYVVCSLLSAPPDYEKIESVTLSSPLMFLKKEKGEKINMPLILSGILVLVMILLYMLVG
jgi:SSS family solute:Na+ symporter